MSNNSGVLLFARNNTKVDYLKQAYFLAKQVKKVLNLPTTVVTDSKNYLLESFPDAEKVFDKILSISWSKNNNNVDFVVGKDENHFYKTYSDGTIFKTKLEFKNNLRSTAFRISPYDETLLLDTDILLLDNLYKHCFTQDHDFLIYDKSYDLAGFRNYSEFQYVSDIGVKFYWATAIFFRKTEKNKIFFELVEHIQDNWHHYKSIFQIKQSYFRNDHAFSIAIHIMNGYNDGDFAKLMPGKLYFTTDKDICHSIKDDKVIFLLEKENYIGEYTLMSWQGVTIHVMNKFSLNRCIDMVNQNV